MPLIISADQVAFLEPQEKVWRGESGKLFFLQELSGTDHLTSLHGIANFDEGAMHYPKTLFRFPLRNVVSSLSENIYDIEKVNELIGAMKSEAKLLLLFLRSVHTIEVYNIDDSGNTTLSFEIKIADAFVQSLIQKRSSFLSELKKCHASQKYNFSKLISFSHKFDVEVYDASEGQTTTSHWLVTNRVDPTNARIRAASVKLKIFPWVGTAVEVDNPGGGRIFCFLPMPTETASNLPVHVNGTFCLNDDRRNLKWPGVERRNDHMADWNRMLVKDVIPSCYVNLLLEAKRSFFPSESFYRAWPDVESLRSTQWEAVLNPVLTALWSQNVIISAIGWVIPSTAVFIPQSGTTPAVVKTALVTCNVELAEVPDRVWDAFDYTRKSVAKVNPTFVRGKLRTCPKSYINISLSNKLDLLKYCLSDGEYCKGQFTNLRLLPLAKGTFIAFQSYADHSTMVYVTTKDCPRELLPNLDHKLVDLSDSDLQTKLLEIAKSNTTQLRELNTFAVSALLDEAMPSSWRDTKTVILPDRLFQSDWFRLFWNWANSRGLSLFVDKLIFPVHLSGAISEHFGVVRLLQHQPLLYIPSHIESSAAMLSLLDKFGIQYCTQESFPYVEHGELSNFVKTYSANALLETIALDQGYASVNLTPEEAEFLRNILSQLCHKGHHRIHRKLLQGLQMFSTCINSSSNLYSIDDGCQQSLLNRVILQPSIAIDLSVYPSELIIFASNDYYQTQLLKSLGYIAVSDSTFLTKYILPNIHLMGDSCIDDIMLNVLDMYSSLSFNDSSIATSIQNLRFIRTASGVRKCPDVLFDPSDAVISNIFKGESVFPGEPYDASKYVKILKNCGLHTSVTPQEIIGVLNSIGLPSSSSPLLVNEATMIRAKAVMKYITSSSFQVQISDKKYKSDDGPVPFSKFLSVYSQRMSWLPVLAVRPDNYPSCLPWKGEGCTSHVISLCSLVCVSHSSSPSLPLAYGSQAYFTHQCDLVEGDRPIQCLVPHLQSIIDHREWLTPDQMIGIIRAVYSSMLSTLHDPDEKHVLGELKAVHDWVYIKKDHKFVNVKSVALKQNLSFNYSSEPYLYILPESISDYSQLFQEFGMDKCITRSQIISMLDKIKEEIEVNPCTVTPEAAWSTVMAVLNWLTDDGTHEIGSESVCIPMESSSEWPDLRERDDLVYTDIEYLKSFISSSESGLSRPFVHSRINQSLAKCLRVTPLSEELEISEDAFEDAGQYEPLVTRLKNILRDYKDGLTIMKELIQNADDAGATEVTICFDARTHTKDRSKLFFPDMCESHGPALVIHNNSTFSSEDFLDIQKLAGATKQSKHLKIGKFGVGFCSVYHITDVPSFVSRDRLYIFDPTLKHLEKAVKNRAQPGKMVKYLSKIITASKQMDPYEGLFGFESKTEYKGTIFRLPFRISASELSDTFYSESTVRDLVENIQQCGDKLLLFLQHVKCISVQRFDPGMSSPRILYKLQKLPSPLIYRSPSPDNTSVVAVKAVRERNQVSTNNWLIATHIIRNKKGTAVSNVACLLNGPDGPDSLYNVCDSLPGEVFCYLPLSQISGLPVHVSCNFAVISNRRGIWTTDSLNFRSDFSAANELQWNSSADKEVHWNIYLMSEVVPVAYLRLLCSLKSMLEKNILQTYNFHSLWPLSSKLEQKNPWKNFVSSLYKLLLGEKLFFSVSTSRWLTFKESKFLDANILCHLDTLPCVLEVLYQLDLPLVNLPLPYRNHMCLIKELLTEEEFVNIFFDNLSELKTVQSSRNEVVYHLLKTCASEKESKPRVCRIINGKIVSMACIPTAPDGTVLRKCTEIVDPRASFSRLFEDCDHRFPIDRLTDDLAIAALKHAGMLHTALPWDLVISSAQSVGTLMKTNSQKALERVRLILSTMSSTGVIGKPPCSGVTIDSIPFLPVRKRPKNYPDPLKWFGGDHQLLPGNQLVLSGPRNQNFKIASSQVAFINEQLPKEGGCGTIFSSRTTELLHIREQPTVDEVIAHLKAVIDGFNSSSSSSSSWVDTACSEIYNHIESLFKSRQPAIDLTELKSICCIWNGKAFLDVDSVATNWKPKDGPYLYATPPEVAAKKSFSSALGIREDFGYKDITRALASMKFDFGAQPVKESHLDLINGMLPVFRKVSAEELNSSKETLYLPDTQNILHNSSELVYNDVSWAPLDRNRVIVNSLFSRDLAIKLGVRLERSKLLEQYVSKETKHFHGVPFGQHEKLTGRIQNIIREYPFNSTIFKELLQNADDAKAKKMYVILDKRTHGKESIISKEWQELQGPALLVWNDSVFSEEDLEGIQKLGLGSKRSDAETIGQFGIGFNVVYHLTDCPSFVTGGNTLCVLDPHCKYVPEAQVTFPGGRYDNLGQGFWNEFKDMGSAYLRTGLTNVPDELRGGSLFRFPIRYSNDMVKSSKILWPPDDEPLKPLTAATLSELMEEWMPLMKQAMFFLNNVTEIKYFVIDSAKESLHTKFHYKTSIAEPPGFAKDCEVLKMCVSNFTNPSGCKTCTILYPLILTDVDCSGKSGKRQDKEEKWLIQSGIGDINDEDQYWRYIKTTKPRHALAAPLEVPEHSKVRRSLFCFLPLSAESGVPVHVNGSFVLNAERKSLWVSSDTKTIDDKAQWNRRLFKAIASSYASFLVRARHHYLKSSYKKWPVALDDLKKYYKLFPMFMATDVRGKWDTLPCDVYKSLIGLNAEVLCVLVSGDTKGATGITVKWRNLISEDPADQVYSWAGAKSRWIIHPILEAIGMKITSAPEKVMDCFNYIFGHLAKLERETAARDAAESEARVAFAFSTAHQKSTSQPSTAQKIPRISPLSVFKYYTEHSVLSSSCVMEQCSITKTVFNDVDTFLVFIKYLVGMELESPSNKVMSELPKNKLEGSASAAFPSGSGSVAGMIYSKCYQLLSSFSTASSTSVSKLPSRNTTTPIVGTSPESSSEITKRKFPEAPFSHFLLLCADGNLRRFDSKNKILNSGFTDLFSGSLDKFLHPTLRAINFDPTYFVQSEDEPGQTLQLIFGIFERTFPHAMKGSNYTGIIKREILLSYWKCFKDDEVFSKHLLEFLKHWALLLTTDNRLFSTSNGVLPAYLPAELPPSFLPDPTIEKVCAIMKSLQMPFLDSSVVIAPVSDCPQLSDRGHILTNFCHMNEDQSLMDSLGKDSIHDLIRYFSKDARPGDDEWLKQIRSLPLFVDVLGEYQPILNVTAFLWPNCCECGYGQWISSANATFIDPSGMWTCLGSEKQLSIDTITVERIYTSYIFPRFGTMSESDRYEHISDIRLCVYPMAKSGRTKPLSDADKFINDLKTVRCIGSESYNLKPISSFCDHTVTIFQFFSCDFQSLPEQLQSEDWLDFFKELGLKQNLEKQEYLELCNKVAGGNVKDVTKCSAVLLQYIFSFKIRQLWFSEHYFLRQVSEIAFVPMVDTTSISWIIPSILCKDRLVKLKGAASHKLKQLLWTVRPIIQLPELCSKYTTNIHISTMLESMGVVYKADVSEVILNIKNISQRSPYSDISLFNNFQRSFLPPEGACLLSEIMFHNMWFLNRHVEALESQLDFPCIPVYCDLLEKKEEKMILVEPSCVLMNSDAVQQYHPYLHSLPQKFNSVFTLLQSIGIKHSLELHHMQIVLQSLFSSSKGRELVDPNAKECVRNAVMCINKLLSTEIDHHKGAIAASLVPLYLPNTNDELKLSTDMMYGDTSCYFVKMELDLGGTGYSHFDITKQHHGVDAKGLCCKLPDKVRPLKMSVVCKLVLAENCQPTCHSDTSSRIEESMQYKSNPSAITELVSKFLHYPIDEENLKVQLANFFSSLTVSAVHDLKTQIMLVESDVVIGEQESEFFIKADQSGSLLYIDHGFDDEDDIVDEIVRHLQGTISRALSSGFSFEEDPDLFKNVKKYLKADTPAKKEKLLSRLQINVIVERPEEKFSFQLGEEIPKSYHDWLDQSPYNLFKPNEYVGYELQDREDHIIYSRIVHQMGHDDHLHRTYFIDISDTESEEVSIFYLYKFIMDNQDTSPTFTDDDLAIVPYTPEDETTVIRKLLHCGDFSEVKERLDKELRDIWKLDPELRRKAIKRLWLKWHPDKNLDDPERSQEIFTYLNEQIDLLKKEDSNPECNVFFPEDAAPASFPFDEWNDIAKGQRATSERRRAAKGDAAGSSPFSEINKERKRPEEGKRWVKQAEIDYKALCDLYAPEDSVYCCICFMAHQVAEKVLKGGVYALCGMDERGLMGHNLTRHALALETVRRDMTKKIAPHTRPLEEYYLNTRYPNRWPGDSIPADHYNERDAQEAQAHALALLETVKSIMP